VFATGGSLLAAAVIARLALLFRALEDTLRLFELKSLVASLLEQRAA
jgi:hypothetical protein